MSLEFEMKTHEEEIVEIHQAEASTWRAECLELRRTCAIQEGEIARLSQVRESLSEIFMRCAVAPFCSLVGPGQIEWEIANLLHKTEKPHG